MQEAKTVTGLEKSSDQLLLLPKSSVVLENLTDAMQSGKKLKELVRDNRLLKDYPATSALLALQTTLENIREKNQLKGSYIKFSPFLLPRISASKRLNATAIASPCCHAVHLAFTLTTLISFLSQTLLQYLIYPRSIIF